MANSVDHAGVAIPPLVKDDPLLLDEKEGGRISIDSIHTSFTPEEIAVQNKIRRKVDFRLCSIAGLLCSLNLLDSGVISAAAVTSMLSDLELNVGKRYAVSIFIFTISAIVFQLPSTIAVRTFGPRIWFAFITVAFGLITLCTAFVKNWYQMIVLRVLLGAAMSGIYPGLTYLISVWYTRKEQQLRFALLQSGEVIVLATGGIVNYALNANLDGNNDLRGWQWMFIVQGAITIFLGLITYLWMVDFPEKAANSFKFLTEAEAEIMVERINVDRGDVAAEKFVWSNGQDWSRLFAHASDLKIWGFCVMYFLLNMVSTSMSYFLPIILQQGMGFDANEAILLNAPVFYWAVVPALVTSYVGDHFHMRGPAIVFNSVVLIIGFCLIGFLDNDHVAGRYIGTFMATGSYVANWAALNAYMANNICGQYKRIFTAGLTTAFNGAGGIAGAYIINYNEAPQYPTAVWSSISYVFPFFQ